MGKLKKALPAAAAAVLVLPGLQASAVSDGSAPENGPAEKGEFSSKEEVVYANLSATGETIEKYIVNIFDVEKAGLITDHGGFTNTK